MFVSLNQITTRVMVTLPTPRVTVAPGARRSKVVNFDEVRSPSRLFPRSQTEPFAFLSGRVQTSRLTRVSQGGKKSVVYSPKESWETKT